MDESVAVKVKKKKAGFALTEVVMSAVIMLIAFAGVMTLVAYAFRANYAARSTSNIVALSYDKFTDLENTSYASIRSGSDTVNTDYSRNWTATTDGNMKTVALTITHTDGLGKTHSKTFNETYFDPEVEGYIDTQGSF